VDGLLPAFTGNTKSSALSLLQRISMRDCRACRTGAAARQCQEKRGARARRWTATGKLVRGHLGLWKHQGLRHPAEHLAQRRRRDRSNVPSKFSMWTAASPRRDSA
jgi:hypothetical protein